MSSRLIDSSSHLFRQPLPMVAVDHEDLCRFTDEINGNFFQFFYMMLYSTHTNPTLFRKTTSQIRQIMLEQDICYCSSQTVPYLQADYTQANLKNKLLKYTGEMDQVSKNIVGYIIKNTEMLVLLTLVGRSIIGGKSPNSKKYDEAVDNSIVYQTLAEAFSYDYELKGQSYFFKGKHTHFEINKNIQQMSVANVSVVVESVKFLQSPPPTAAKSQQQKDEAESIELSVDCARDAVEHSEIKDKIDEGLQFERYDISQPTYRRLRQQSKNKEMKKDDRPRFDYLSETTKILVNEQLYDRRYPIKH